MADLIFIAVALAFFALCALYIGWCDRIIGPDLAEVSRSDDFVDESATDEVAA